MTKPVLFWGMEDTGQRSGFLNKYIRYDCMTIAMQYLGMAIRGIPYMGVGRNLAYRRSVFFENKGFGNHNHIVSGDDDLFVNSNASGKNTLCGIQHRNTYQIGAIKNCCRMDDAEDKASDYCSLL